MATDVKLAQIAQLELKVAVLKESEAKAAAERLKGEEAYRKQASGIMPSIPLIARFFERIHTFSTRWARLEPQVRRQ